MLPSNSVILKDNATLLDHSGLLSDVQEAGLALSIVAAEDALYVGADLPFNHRYFQILESAVNAQAGSVSVDIWDGQAWRPAVKVHDMTSQAGIPFVRSGIIMWTPDRDYDWGLEDTTEDIPALSTLKIYDKYWARFTFSAAFAFTLQYVGQKFSKDSDLRIHYRELDRAEIREAVYGLPTPNWDVMHINAAEEIVAKLRSRQIIWSRNQILEPDQFAMAAAHKVAAVIYSPGNLNQPEKMEDAEDKYKDAMSQLNFKVDRNGNGKVERCESIGFSSVRRR